MFKSLLNYLAPPIFPDDEEKTRKARYANVIALTFIFVALGYETGTRLIRGQFSFGMFDIVLVAVAAIVFVGWLMLRRGYVNATSILLVVLIWVASNSIAATGFGIRDTSYILNFSIILMTGLLLGWRASVIVTIISIGTGFVLGVAEDRGWISSPAYPATSFAQDMTFVFILNTTLIYLLITGLEREIKRSQASFKELKLANTDLQQVQTTLQERNIELAQRGIELEVANEQVHKRVLQFEALSQVSQASISVHDLQDLLPRITNMISEKFGFYHVGIFLIDEINQYAVLSATNSEGGRRMLERKHRLRVGEQGIVGMVASTGEPRVAMDVGVDAVFFNNPELSDTHSEAALPLKSGDRIIGALDVQSTQTAAFTEEDIQLLSLLANQVSLAIENARLFDETRNALAKAEIVSRQFTREAWGRLHTEQNLIGYRYNLAGASPLEKPIELTGSGNGQDNGKQMEASQVVVPIELRGETIGNLVVQSPSGGFSQDQIDIIKAVAERVALSAENARLFEETTRRAERERLVSDITGKIRSVTDPQSMIQTAMDELRKVLGASRVEVIPQHIKGSE